MLPNGFYRGGDGPNRLVQADVLNSPHGEENSLREYRTMRRFELVAEVFQLFDLDAADQYACLVQTQKATPELLSGIAKVNVYEIVDKHY